jgi:hypothetical protein
LREKYLSRLNSIWGDFFYKSAISCSAEKTVPIYK